MHQVLQSVLSLESHWTPCKKSRDLAGHYEAGGVHLRHDVTQIFHPNLTISLQRADLLNLESWTPDLLLNVTSAM